MSTAPQETAVVLGTGMMGPGIALSLARGGLPTTIVSRTAEGAERGLAAAHEQLTALAAHGLCSAPEAAAIRQRLTAGVDLAASVSAAAWVFESAPEDLPLKQALFAELDALAPSAAILATNTSGLSINAVAESCRHKHRILTAHWWNPPHLMKLVELVPNDETSAETITRTRSLLERCGKAPVLVKKDRPGQLGNRLQHALVREAIHIVAEGIADAEDVDLAAKAGFGLRLPVYGIFEHQDAVGLDLVLAIQDYVNPDLARDQGAHELLRTMVAEGRSGMRAGQGFHDWSKKDWNEVRRRRDEFILHFLKSDF